NGERTSSVRDGRNPAERRCPTSRVNCEQSGDDPVVSRPFLLPRSRNPMFGRKAQTLITAEQALPGRDEPLQVTDDHFVLHRPIKPPFPEGIETATFGMGCFWGAERAFWTLPGVYTT